jgi:tRNA dimethylallyltransferase
MTGRTYTSFRKNERKERPFRIVKIALTRPRDIIYERINKRVDQMIADGLIDEARNLYPQRHLNALNTVGYKELFTYFDGTWTFDEAVERMKGNTRRYARKQLTWFKKDPNITWFSPENQSLIINHIESNG